MANTKPLSVKQLTVIDDLFEGRLEESEILNKHNLRRQLYYKWLGDDNFNNCLDWRLIWEQRKSEFMLAYHSRIAVSNLVKLTYPDHKQLETARKACLDIITMRSNLLRGASPVLSDNPTSLPEFLKFTPETAGKLLDVVVEAKK